MSEYEHAGWWRGAGGGDHRGAAAIVRAEVRTGKRWRQSRPAELCRVQTEEQPVNRRRAERRLTRRKALIPQHFSAFGPLCKSPELKRGSARNRGRRRGFGVV